MHFLGCIFFLGFFFGLEVGWTQGLAILAHIGQNIGQFIFAYRVLYWAFPLLFHFFLLLGPLTLFLLVSFFFGGLLCFSVVFFFRLCPYGMFYVLITFFFCICLCRLLIYNLYCL